MIFVFDACALIAYLNNEPGSDVIQVVPVISEKIFHEAARLKAAYKMSIADGIGIATAIELSGQFITSDHHELDAVAENESSLIFWFR